MTTSFVADGQASSFVMTNKATVIESSSASVTTKNEVISDFQNSVTTEKTTKQEFLASCGAAPATPLEKGAERVTVPAGTFDTEWVLSKSSGEGAEGTSKVWLTTLSSGESLMVKMVVESSSSRSSGPGSMLSELMETNKR
jgi:hypothetical protein